MRSVRPIPPHANDDPPSPPVAPSRSDRYKLILSRCVTFARPTILGLLVVIFLARPIRTPPDLELDPGFSLSSLNISISHCKLITVEYTHTKLVLSFDSQLGLSRPSNVATFAQGPSSVASVRAKVQSTLVIVTDSGVNDLVNKFNGGEVTIDVAAKAEWRLRLGLWWVAVFNADISRMGLTFKAPTDSEGGGDWMILDGTLSCSLNIIPQL